MLLATPLRNTLRIWGTTWEHGKNTLVIHEKKNLFPLPPTLKTQIKKLGAPKWMLTLPIDCMQFSFPKLLITFLA